MSRFYASIKGSAKSGVTRQGTPKSGIQGHIRGRDIGIEVRGYVNSNGRDVFNVYLTGGSNGHSSPRAIGTFSSACQIVTFKSE